MPSLLPLSESYELLETGTASLLSVLLGSRLTDWEWPLQEKIINIDDEADNMYIVRRGVCASEGNIYMRQGVFGMDMLEVRGR